MAKPIAQQTIPFEIHLPTDKRQRKVLIGDQDVTLITHAVHLDCVEDRYPTLQLELVPGANPTVLKGEGVVYMTPATDDIDQQAALRGFLEAIDADELEKAMLELQTQGGFGGMGPGEAALTALRKWASGE